MLRYSKLDNNILRYSPLVLASSTRNISLTNFFGDLYRTVYAVLSNVLQCSLWKGTITLTVGKSSMYILYLHPECRMSGMERFSGILSLSAPLKPFTEYSFSSKALSSGGKWDDLPCSPIP